MITYRGKVIRTERSPVVCEVDIAELGKQLWSELHSQQNPTPEWFADWLSSVPSFGCGCLESFTDYLVTNPPRYDDWFAWTVEAHNWVNSKLDRNIWSIDQAKKQWNSSREHFLHH